jgi:hypothetical protein
MKVNVVKGCIIAAIALAAGAWAETARAEEAYICDAGRVVYVKPGQLETLKREDPCIAKYFEQTPSVKPAARAAQVDLPPAVTAKPRPPEPVGDFRNVRVINAGPGADAWFQHRR